MPSVVYVLRLFWTTCTGSVEAPFLMSNEREFSGESATASCVFKIILYAAVLLFQMNHTIITSFESTFAFCALEFSCFVSSASKVTKPVWIYKFKFTSSSPCVNPEGRSSMGNPLISGAGTEVDCMSKFTLLLVSFTCRLGRPKDVPLWVNRFTSQSRTGQWLLLYHCEGGQDLFSDDVIVIRFIFERFHFSGMDFILPSM